MIDLRLVQWSDLHFAATPVPAMSPARAVKLASEAVRRDYGTSAIRLVLSGDITTQGKRNGYSEAERSIRDAQEVMNVSGIFVCPGNHDIGAANPTEFIEFNKFAFRVTNDPSQQWSSKRAVRVVTADRYSIILVNSAYKGDHRFGAVPLTELRSALENTAPQHQIVLLHHSPISSAYAGGGMENAYDLLALIGQYDVAAVLHGHVHSDQGLRFGDYGTLLYGAGSLGFEPDANMNNQFVVHEFSDGKVSTPRLYRYFRNTDRFEAASK